MKQIDIFGNEVDIKNVIKKDKQKRLTIKENFRNKHGYKKGYKCSDCIYFCCSSYHNKNYYKCKIMGISSSKATDIRLKDVACNLFKGGIKDD